MNAMAASAEAHERARSTVLTRPHGRSLKLSSHAVHANATKSPVANTSLDSGERPTPMST